MCSRSDYAHLEEDARQVRVSTPQGSVFDGILGTIVLDNQDSQTVLVRLDAPYSDLVLRGELKEARTQGDRR